MNELREAAIEYAIRGWAVFPLKPRTKQPSPMVPQGYLEASTWAPDCLYWWEREPESNIGIACHASGLVVIDVDERAGGFDTMYEFERLYGNISDVPNQLTPTGGEHLIFKHPGVELKGQLGPGVDIKDYGYILAAPSVHPRGGEYVWGADDLKPIPLPEAWVDVLQRPSQQARNFTLSPSNEPLLQIPAEHYFQVLAGRPTFGGWGTCPFHKDGCERTPSFKVSGTMWACFGCEPLMGKQVMGGNLLDLAGMLWGYALPLRGADLQEVKDRCEAMFRSIVPPTPPEPANLPSREISG